MTEENADVHEATPKNMRAKNKMTATSATIQPLPFFGLRRHRRRVGGRGGVGVRLLLSLRLALSLLSP